MSQYVRFCKRCSDLDPEFNKVIRGRFSTYLDENNYTCEVCGSTVYDLSMTSDDYKILTKISRDPKFINGMIELHEKDPIEYQLKMSQFKCQIGEQESTSVKCPKCGSTNITASARGVNMVWGFIGASKTVNRCANCGHTWKP